MTIKTYAAVLSALVLTACGPSTTPITTAPVQVSHSTTRPVQRYEIVPARAVMFDASGKRVELAGVPCRLNGAGLAAAYTTPANLNIPIYGPNSSTVSVGCSHEGKTVQKVVGPVNKTREAVANSGSGAGLLGALIATSVAAGRGNRANDEYSYERFFVDVNKRPRR